MQFSDRKSSNLAIFDPMLILIVDSESSRRQLPSSADFDLKSVEGAPASSFFNFSVSLRLARAKGAPDSSFIYFPAFWLLESSLRVCTIRAKGAPVSFFPLESSANGAPDSACSSKY